MAKVRITNAVISEVVSDVAGPDVVELVLKLKDTKNYSEIKLSEDLDQEINYTRNQLYRLLNNNLVSFVRRKDKRKGWYIYYWTFKKTEIRHVLLKIKQEKLDKLKDRVEREESETYYSAPDGLRLPFETAMEYDFRCPETGDILELEDNTKKIKDLKKDIKELEKFLKENTA